jgi:hypothetical protein
MDLSQQVLEKIEKNKIQPLPRYKILLKRSVFWSLTILALLLGSLSASVTIFVLANAEWDIWSKVTGSIWHYVFLVFPYFWLIIFIGFVLLAYYNLRHTKYGYRYPLFKIVIGYALVTIILGNGFYRFGLGAKIEELMIGSTNFYAYLPSERQVWIKTDLGLLGGLVADTDGVRNFLLTDQTGQVWQVSVTGTANLNHIFPGAKVKIIGEQSGTSSFWALEIRTWCGCGGCERNTRQACGNNPEAATGCATANPVCLGCERK